jgi:hypothetical protein
MRLISTLSGYHPVENVGDDVQICRVNGNILVAYPYSWFGAWGERRPVIVLLHSGFALGATCKSPFIGSPHVGCHLLIVLLRLLVGCSRGQRCCSWVRFT